MGKATWRLVSAPLIPGLLSLDPTVDHTHLLSSLDMGSEFEVQFGKSLQVTVTWNSACPVPSEAMHSHQGLAMESSPSRSC